MKKWSSVLLIVCLLLTVSMPVRGDSMTEEAHSETTESTGIEDVQTNGQESQNEASAAAGAKESSDSENVETESENEVAEEETAADTAENDGEEDTAAESAAAPAEDAAAETGKEAAVEETAADTAKSGSEDETILLSTMAEERGVSISVGDADFVDNGKQVAELENVTWDEATRTLTLNNYSGGGFFIQTFGGDGLNKDIPVTIKLIGENTMTGLSAFSADSLLTARYVPLMIEGDGSLTIDASKAYACLEAQDLTQKARLLRMIGSGSGYGINSFSQNEGNIFRFLGGTTDISNVTIGIDTQAGDMEVRNATIRIDVHDDEERSQYAIGIGVGHMGHYDAGHDNNGDFVWGDPRMSGGTLTLENANIEIRSDSYQMYVVKVVDESGNHAYYTGKNDAENKGTFSSTFVWDGDDASKDYLPRYSRMTPNGQRYLLITPENVTIRKTEDIPATEEIGAKPETKPMTDPGNTDQPVQPQANVARAMAPQGQSGSEIIAAAPETGDYADFSMYAVLAVFSIVGMMMLRQWKREH